METWKLTREVGFSFGLESIKDLFFSTSSRFSSVSSRLSSNALSLGVRITRGVACIELLDLSFVGVTLGAIKDEE